MTEAGRWLWDVRTPMRDGVALSTDLHLPPGGPAGGPYPAVLIRTAANNQAPAYVTRARTLADQGFAVAIQDVRGREDADGVFAPFRDEGPDGYDSVEWLAEQDWCIGKVGMMGSGYAAWTQWAAAREKPPHLVTLASTSVWAPGRQSRSGMLSLPMLEWLHAMSARVWQEAGQVEWEKALRHLPLRAADEAIGARLPNWHEWLDCNPAAAYWQHLDLTPEDFAGIDVPALHVTGWQDADQEAVLRYYAGMREHSPAAADQSLVIGSEEVDRLHREWFQHWLVDADAAAAPQSGYRVTGSNAWRDGAWATSAAATETLHLHSQGAANTLDGNGTLSAEPAGGEPADRYSYDPNDPVIVSTDFTFFPSPPKQPPQPSLDRRFIERRPDVLVYTSAGLADAMTLSGCPSLQLFVSSDRLDTDWLAQLSDVAPGGDSLLLATGGLRARHRTGLDTETFLEPGDVHEVTIELSGVAHAMQVGHRLRLSVMSSCFPLFDRNLNTGSPIGHDTVPLVAANAIHHDTAHPSRLTLPVGSSGDGDV